MINIRLQWTLAVLCVIMLAVYIAATWSWKWIPAIVIGVTIMAVKRARARRVG
jgi:hypothetical protein